MTPHRFLANESYPAAPVDWLRNEGNDVIHAATELAGVSDLEILGIAREQERVLLTFDPDFGELMFHQRSQPPAGIVLFRMPQHSFSLIDMAVKAFFATNPELIGYFTVVTPLQYRQTPLSK